MVTLQTSSASSYATSRSIKPKTGGRVIGTRKPTETEARKVVTEGFDLGIYDDIDYHVQRCLAGNWYIIEYEIDKEWKKLWPTDHRDAMRTRLFYDDDLGAQIK